MEKKAQATGRRVVVTWDDVVDGPHKDVSSSIVNDLGVWVRREIPMNVPHFDKLPEDILQGLLTHLSVSCFSFYHAL